MSLLGKHAGAYRAALQSRVALPASGPLAVEEATRAHLTCLSRLGAELDLCPGVLFQHRPAELPSEVVDFWGTIFWNLVVSEPSVDLFLALKALQRELLTLAPRPGTLTPRSWELLGSVTLAIMLLSLRFGGAPRT